MMRLIKAPQALATRMAHRSNSTIAGTVYYRCNYHNPERIALISPAESLKLTYGELWAKVMAVAGGLTNAGFGAGSVVATDLDRSAHSVFLQMAAAHNGMQLLTVKDEEEYNRLAPMVYAQGAVSASSDSFLKGMTIAELLSSGGKAGEGATDRSAPLAYYSTDEVTSNRQLYLHGVGIAGLLKIQPGEQVCVAASLNNSFGMGAVLSAVVRSGIIYFPPEGSTDLGGSSVLIADKRTLDSFVEKADKPTSDLRGGLLKVGEYNSASDIPLICGSSQAAGTTLYELSGKGKYPLFDACSDTYFPVSL
jgi:hypothetical protein